MMSERKQGVLERRLQTTRPVTDLTIRGMLNVQLADAHFVEDFEDVTVTEELSMSAFNVLRILRGQTEGHARNEIARRMIYRKADLTRIIDGLVRRGLAERVRSRQDRRLSLTRITPKGLKMVGRLDPLVGKLVERYRRKLSPQDWDELSRLLEAVYEDHVE
jgi:DNA-binding MarR family transcriptional regulator